MRSAPRPLVAGLLALCVAPPGAVAATGQPCQAPPGTSAIDQYCEVVPNSSGPGTHAGAAPDGGGTGGQVGGAAGPSTRRALEAAGVDGKALLQVPTPAPKRAAGSREAGGVGGSTEALSRPAANPLSAVASAASSGETLNRGFTWAALALSLGILGAGWLRYRARA
jgi:hypothetical protein